MLELYTPKAKQIDISKRHTKADAVYAISRFYINCWSIGLFSNEEILLVANHLSGRSASDLQMYPIFPLVKNRVMCMPI